MSKNELRKTYLAQRLATPKTIIEEKSKEISTRLLQLDDILHAQTLCGYFAFRNEVDLRSAYDVLFQSKKVYFPKFIPQQNQYIFVPIRSFSETIQGKYGILEPASTDHALSIEQAAKLINLWLIPLVSFDENCTRLGYGGGYYDRFLEHAKGHRLGIAFEFQKTEILNCEQHDIAMDGILTEARLYRKR